MQLGTERSVLRPRGSATGCHGIRVLCPQAGTAFPKRQSQDAPECFHGAGQRRPERYQKGFGGLGPRRRAAAAENGAIAPDAADWRRECAVELTNNAGGGPERRAAEFAISGAAGVPARRGLRNPPLCEPKRVSTSTIAGPLATSDHPHIHHLLTLIHPIQASGSSSHATSSRDPPTSAARNRSS